MCNKMTTKENILKEFDEKFARINHLHRGECAITDITGTKFEAHTDENGLVTQIGGLESVKDFLSTSIDKLLEEIVPEEMDYLIGSDLPEIDRIMIRG